MAELGDKQRTRSREIELKRFGRLRIRRARRKLPAAFQGCAAEAAPCLYG